MPVPRVCVLRAPGTNCDVETAFAFETAGAKAERVHLFRLLESPGSLSQYQIVCIPGGFSYGDDIGAGVVFAAKLRNRLADVLAEFLQRETLMLGICNGFQVLLKAGLLPDGTENWPPSSAGERPATLTWNDNGRYTARWVHLRVASAKNVFLRGIERMELPIAHAEGKIVPRDPAVLSGWQKRAQIALRYSRPEKDGSGGTSPANEDNVLPYPFNPNGSAANIAGLSDPTGRVLGLMPHPERFLFRTQHPQWTRQQRERDGDEGAGLRLFRNAVRYFVE